MKLLFLLSVCFLCGCSMQTTAYRAIDMGRVEDNNRIQMSDFGGNVAYATEIPDNTKHTERTNHTNTVTKSLQTTLSEFTTEIPKGDSARLTNIQKSAENVNHTTIKPGEVFSFNDTVGPTGKSRGFRLARIFIKGRDAKGYGGGVCQVSSTLYQAAEEAGLEIIERHPHSKPVTYVDKGEDAATSFGGKDLKFKNNKNSDIMIQAHVENNQVTVKIIG